MRKLKCSTIVNDLLLELIMICLKIVLFGSVGVILFGTLLLTITATIYNMAVSVDVLRKISKRSNAYKVTSTGPAIKTPAPKAPKKIKKKAETDANPDLEPMFNEDPDDLRAVVKYIWDQLGSITEHKEFTSNLNQYAGDGEI